MTVQGIPDNLVEAAAKALYENARDPDYTEECFDWPNIDTGYDKDDDDPDPEWLRNRIRSDARAVLAAVLPLVERRLRDNIAAELNAEMFAVDGYRYGGATLSAHGYINGLARAIEVARDVRDGAEQ